jgi:hypothetical protein
VLRSPRPTRPLSACTRQTAFDDSLGVLPEEARRQGRLVGKSYLPERVATQWLRSRPEKEGGTRSCQVERGAVTIHHAFHPVRTRSFTESLLADLFLLARSSSHGIVLVAVVFGVSAMDPSARMLLSRHHFQHSGDYWKRQRSPAALTLSDMVADQSKLSRSATRQAPVEVPRYRTRPELPRQNSVYVKILPSGDRIGW